MNWMPRKGWLINKKSVWIQKRPSGDWIRGSAHLFRHLFIIALSVSIVLSLPLWVSFIVRKVLIYWSFIGNEKIFLASMEIILAILIILFSNYIGKNWRNKKLSAMAQTAGLVMVLPARGVLAQRRIRKLKGKQGFARDVMILGSTGIRTFGEPGGELLQVIQHCREAKIMLLNPDELKATANTKGIPHSDVTPEIQREQINQSIDFLKRLKALQRNIKLKLYSGPPLIKLTILGDYLWVQHYHTDFDIEGMPKYVFKHGQNPGGLYVPFYQYFWDKWNCPDIPEYDLDNDELIFRDLNGNECQRRGLDLSTA